MSKDQVHKPETECPETSCKCAEQHPRTAHLVLICREVSVVTLNRERCLHRTVTNVINVLEKFLQLSIELTSGMTVVLEEKRARTRHSPA